MVNIGISRDPNNLNNDFLKDICHATRLKKARFHKNSYRKGLVHLRYEKAPKQFIQIAVSAMAKHIQTWLVHLRFEYEEALELRTERSLVG
jgi:hypothetical protein